MGTSIQAVWTVKSLDPTYFVVRDSEAKGFFISGPFDPVDKLFSTYGQALAAIGFALDEEWSRVEFLKFTASKSRRVKVVGSKRKGGNTAYVVELRIFDNDTLVSSRLFVVCNGKQQEVSDLASANSLAENVVSSSHQQDSRTSCDIDKGDQSNGAAIRNW